MLRGSVSTVSFAVGDRFGARARSDGLVEVYKNGTLIGVADVTGWPYYGFGGRIGVWTTNAATVRLDDFGGGTASFTPPTIQQTVTTINYTYDGLYRLTQAQYTGSFQDTFAYAYDRVGNRLVQTHTLTNTQVTHYLYDQANRLTSVNGQPYAYDTNGNLTHDGTHTYLDDQANRLKQRQSVPGTLATFAYNGDGQRLQASSSVNYSLQSYQYTLDTVSALPQVLVANDMAYGANTTRYLYGNGRIGEYGSVAWQYYLPDGLGSVRQTAHSARGISWARRYDPYGNVMATAIDPVFAPNPQFGFAGEQTDNTGLQYLRARYYAPQMGRFFQRDAFAPDALMPQKWNLYNYGLNNPIRYTDPSGHDPVGLEAGTGWMPPDYIDCHLGQSTWSACTINRLENQINWLKPLPKRTTLQETALTGYEKYRETLIPSAVAENPRDWADIIFEAQVNAAQDVTQWAAMANSYALGKELGAGGNNVGYNPKLAAEAIQRAEIEQRDANARAKDKAANASNQPHVFATPPPPQIGGGWELKNGVLRPILETTPGTFDKYVLKDGIWQPNLAEM